METEFIISNSRLNGKRVWTFREDSYSYTHYTSNCWWCGDGDGVSLSIEIDESGFDLRCFSGIPGASFIHVDFIDFDSLWRKAFQNNLEVGSISKYTFTQQCIMIADYLCSLFCEYTDSSDYKIVETPNK